MYRWITVLLVSVIAGCLTGDLSAAPSAPAQYYPPVAQAPKEPAAPAKPQTQPQAKAQPKYASPEYEFKSRYLDKPLAAHSDLYSPWEAEKYILPLMQNHPWLFKGKQVLDIGTGTGIVGIYAAKLGAAKVVSTDIDPLAITYTGLNAQTLGVDRVMDIRNVPVNTPQAYSVIKPGEKFYVIMANMPYVQDIHASNLSNLRNDNGVLLMSMVDGLHDHLNKGGSAILLYRSYFTQQFLIRYAKMKGYEVHAHPVDRIARSEMGAALQEFMDNLVKQRGIDPKKISTHFDTGSEIALIRPKNIQPLFGPADTDKAYYGGMTIIKIP